MRLKLLFALPAAVLVAAATPADDKYVTIRGQITFEKAPKAEVVNVTTDKDKCCKDGDLISSLYEVDAKSKGFANVFVFLRPDDNDKDAKFPQDKIHPDLAKPKSKQHVIDQPKCQFEPRVVAAREGDTLLVKNSSEITHNVHYTGKGKDDANFEFNVTVPAGKEHEVKEPLVAFRTPATVKCSIHPWMEGRVYVFDHPYYTLTDKDGKFELKDVPVGKWRIVYRHETVFHTGAKGNLGFPIEVKADKKTMEMEKLEFVVPPPPK